MNAVCKKQVEVCGVGLCHKTQLVFLKHNLQQCKAKHYLFSIKSYNRRAVAQPCVNGDRLSQWRMAKFDPAQIRNPLSLIHI